MRCIFRLRYRSWLNFSGRCFRIGSHIFSYSFQISREPFLTPSRNSCSFIKRRWLEHLWLLYVYRSKRLYYKLIHMHSLFSSISGQKSILHTYVTYIHRFLFFVKGLFILTLAARYPPPPQQQPQQSTRHKCLCAGAADVVSELRNGITETLSQTQEVVFFFGMIYDGEHHVTRPKYQVCCW